MIFRKNYKFCLCQSSPQEKFFNQFAGACRWVYNRGLHQRKSSWEKEKKSISLFDQNNELVLLKKQEETSWLKEVHSQILQQALDDLNHAFQSFFQRVKSNLTPGYPRFKRKGERDSFRYPQGVRIEGNKAWLPKIGWVRFRKSREIIGKIKQTTILKEGRHWHVVFSCEIEKEVVPTNGNDVVGIDLGLEHFVTVANDNGIYEVTHPRFLKKSLLKVKYLSRQLSKKKRKGKNRCRAKLRLNKEHTLIRNQREDYLHKLSTHLVKSHDKIVVENLKVKELLMNTSRNIARSISDAGWRSFLQMLKYKCLEYGKTLLEVSQYFPSTKQCYKCKKRNDLSLSVREYQCSCGHKIHRDHNAALNLKAAGMSV